MKRNPQDKINRMAFIKMSIEQPQETINFYKDKIKKLEAVKNHSDTVKVLRESLFLSEQTIYKDYYF